MVFGMGWFSSLLQFCLLYYKYNSIYQRLWHNWLLSSTLTLVSLNRRLPVSNRTLHIFEHFSIQLTTNRHVFSTYLHVSFLLQDTCSSVYNTRYSYTKPENSGFTSNWLLSPVSIEFVLSNGTILFLVIIVATIFGSLCDFGRVFPKKEILYCFGSIKATKYY